MGQGELPVLVELMVQLFSSQLWVMMHVFIYMMVEGNLEFLRTERNVKSLNKLECHCF